LETSTLKLDAIIYSGYLPSPPEVGAVCLSLPPSPVLIFSLEDLEAGGRPGSLVDEYLGRL